MPIKAITFDLDNTLWHIDDAIQVAEQQAFAYLLSHCPEIELHHSIPSVRRLMFELVEKSPDLSHQISRLRKMALATALEQSGYSTDEALHHAERAFQIFLKGRHQVTLFDDTLEVLARLHQDYRLGALTNGNADINLLPVRPYFDFAFSAEECMSSKPAATLFKAALNHTGLTPAECIHVGDHPEQDIFGAQQLGFYTVWMNFDNREWPGGVRANAEISCLSDLLEAIRAIERMASQSF